MTPFHRHLQLHLFEPARSRAMISPAIRQRLLALIMTLLNEAASDTLPATAPDPNAEGAGDE